MTATPPPVDPAPLGEWLTDAPPAREGVQYLRTNVGLWWCGDDVCDCHQPIATRIYADKRSSTGYLGVDVWRGTFHCEPTPEDKRAMNKELNDVLRELTRRGDTMGDVTVFDTAHL